jgi:hypothetical protein
MNRDAGRSFVIVDRGNLDAEIARLAGPGRVREGDEFVVIVPVPSPARASVHEIGGANVPN